MSSASKAQKLPKEKSKKKIYFAFMQRKDFPLLILAAGIIITAGVWDFSNRVRSDQIFKETQYQADQIRLLLNNHFETNLRILPNFGGLIENISIPMAEDGQKYLKGNFQTDPSLLALQLVRNNSNEVLWTSAPFGKNPSYFKQYFTKKIFPLKEWKALKEKADQQNEVILSSPMSLGVKEKPSIVFAIYPIRDMEGDSTAFFIQYIDFQILLEQFFKDQNLIHYNFLISHQWEILFSNLKYSNGVSADRPFKVTRQIEIADKAWWLNFWPKEEYLAGQVQYEITGLFLLMMGILFSISTSLFARSLVTRGETLERLVLERTEQLKMKNEELEKFIYIVSHDLKAPLVSIKGFTSLLGSSGEMKMSDEDKHCLDRIEANTKRMHEMVQDLLELSRVGQLEEVVSEVNVQKIVNEIIDEMKPTMDQKKIQVGIKGNFPVIQASSTRIYQVFSNLIGNAVKYLGTPENPTIEVGVNQNGKDYEFYVEDNGMGIPEEEQDKVFMVFQRGDDSGGIEGTGVGLSIVKKIVESLKGRIWLKSKEGQGSTFYFSIPKTK